MPLQGRRPQGQRLLHLTRGGYYVGSWSKEPKAPHHLNDTFYLAALGGRLPQKCSSVGWCGNAADKHLNFPRIYNWESDGEAGDISFNIIDTLEVLSPASFESTVPITLERRAPCCFSTNEAKKPGQMIAKGHNNYEMILYLQLGTSNYSVGKVTSANMRELKPKDVDPMQKFWTRFTTERSKVTLPHQSMEFQWKDYCPLVFRHLRQLFKLDPVDYMVAICGSDALQELSSPRKSGSIFY